MPIKSREIVQAARWDLRSFFVKGIAPKFKLELVSIRIIDSKFA